MERSRRSITNVEGQTERLAWADAYLAELNESIRAIVQPTHSLCMELQCRLTGLETKLALTNRAITEELNIMWMEIIRMRDNCLSCPSLSIPFRYNYRHSSDRVDNMEEYLAHVRDTLGQDLDEPEATRDLD
ncbi:hypothetical protein CJ030_MR5G003549 [Morella rubra]|uniref:Uncharacterized protein n=1 Tax=Morella rubra TaxID=262757 RepID=A0A6A1VKI0_9ROSI|nr:hypothetical protein CJ030_MR5G003549 [Morella rubra]